MGCGSATIARGSPGKWPHWGDLTEFWARHPCGELRFAEWYGASVFAFAATGPCVADYVQTALGREIEWLAARSSIRTFGPATSTIS
jgi:hypothetical protein